MQAASKKKVNHFCQRSHKVDAATESSWYCTTMEKTCPRSATSTILFAVNCVASSSTIWSTLGNVYLVVLPAHEITAWKQAGTPFGTASGYSGYSDATSNWTANWFAQRMSVVSKCFSDTCVLEAKVRCFLLLNGLLLFLVPLSVAGWTQQWSCFPCRLVPECPPGTQHVCDIVLCTLTEGQLHIKFRPLENIIFV